MHRNFPLKIYFALILVMSAMVISLSSCKTQKRKDEVSGLGKFYHNTTARYNGYFNANVLYQEAELRLMDGYRHNYNQLLPVFPILAANEPKSVEADLDKAIEKLGIVISIHRPSDWTDDSYLLMGQVSIYETGF